MMQPYYNQSNKKEYYEYQPVEDYSALKKDYPAVQEYEAKDYWTPEYEDIQKKYSGKEYENKQYVPENTKEGYGKDTADYLVGNQYDNTIETYEKNDIVEAGYGNDKIDAGKDDDWIWGISKEHNAEDKKYARAEYVEVDWYTAGEGKDIYALGTEKYAHYATNGAKDYAIITDYTPAEDTVMLYGTADNYVVGESVTVAEDKTIKETAAAIYWDKDGSGAYSKGDDMVAVFEGYSAEEITAAKNNWMYVKSETPVA